MNKTKIYKEPLPCPYCKKGKVRITVLAGGFGAGLLQYGAFCENGCREPNDIHDSGFGGFEQMLGGNTGRYATAKNEYNDWVQSLDEQD